MNGRYAVTTLEDRYPFYQDEILGGVDTTGVFTVNSNTATLTITPDASYTNPDDGAMNVNVRLDMFNTPEIDFNVTSTTTGYTNPLSSPATTSVSNTSGNYPSTTTITYTP